MRLDVAPAEDLIDLVRAQDKSVSIVLVVASGRDALSMALTRAAIAPLAIERAPSARLNAVFPAPGADPAAVDRAVAFLRSARSTTGQLLDVG